jgi:hypothetical protein
MVFCEKAVASSVERIDEVRAAFVDVITRISHYESFTISGTGYNVIIMTRCG